jgi:hypothetical protein
VAAIAFWICSMPNMVAAPENRIIENIICRIRKVLPICR